MSMIKRSELKPNNEESGLRIVRCVQCGAPMTTIGLEKYGCSDLRDNLCPVCLSKQLDQYGDTESR
jgi:hypothetical protein